MSPRTADSSAPRPARVICEPGSPVGRGWPRQPSTVGVRSVSTTIPACLVEGARSRPDRYAGPLIVTTCRCGGMPVDPAPITSSVVPRGSSAVIAASSVSACRTAAARALPWPPDPSGSDPRSTTASGQRASTARLTAETAGR